MDSDEQKIYKELLKINEKAANAYKGGLRVLEDRKNPDRIPQSAHSIREVDLIFFRNVSITEGNAKTNEKETFKKKIEEGLVPDSEQLPVPSEEKAKGLADELFKLHNKTFLPVAHHMKDISEEEFSDKIARFNTILLQFLRTAREVTEELDTLLSIDLPEEKDIEKLSQLLKKPIYVQYFFQKLSSPNWLPCLKKKGFFSEPPGNIKKNNGVMFPVWPLSQYLMNIADKKPKEVMDIIKEIPLADNPYINTDFIECALKMPSSIAKEIVPLFEKWISEPFTVPMSPYPAKLAVKLFEEGKADSALELLKTLLKIKIHTTDAGGRAIKEAQPVLDTRSYTEILSKAIPTAIRYKACEVIKILCDKLNEAIQGKYKEEVNSAPYDHSYIWRSAIEDNSQNEAFLDDLKSLLVTSIRDSIELTEKTDKETFKKCYRLLCNYNFPIYRRLELYFMRKFPRLLDNEIQSVLLNKEFFEDTTLEHEYYHLLSEQFVHLPQNIKDTILKWIDQGPDIEKLKSLYKNNEIPIDQKKIDAYAYKARWQIRYLSAIENAAPEKWKEKYQKLLKEYGKPSHPDFPHYQEEVIWGDRSPLSKEEISKMIPQEVINYLKEWTPPKNPAILKDYALSKEGLAAKVMEVVSENPENYTKICEQFKTLDPVYIVYLVRGLTNAVKKKKSLDWGKMLVFCKKVLEEYRSAENVYDKENREYNATSIKMEILDLLKEGLSKRVIKFTPEIRKIMWDIINALLIDKDPDVKYENENAKIDSLTLSLNTVRGSAMHALVQYALWCADSLKSSNNNKKVMVSEVKDVLEKKLNPTSEPTRTIRSLYGYYFPILLYLDKKWAVDHISHIFPENSELRKLWRTAWENYLEYPRFYDDVYNTLKPQYKRAVEKLESPRISDEAKKRLSEHLTIAYLKGEEKIDNKPNLLISLFFKKANPDIRGHIIWFIGKELKNNPPKDVEMQTKVAKRAINFLDWRIKELEEVKNSSAEEFYKELQWSGLWVSCPLFDKLILMPYLYSILKLTKGKIKFKHYIIEKLPSHDNITESLQILNLLIKGCKRNEIIIFRNDIERLLAKASEKPHSTKIKDLSNDVVNSLIEKGYFDFEKFYM